jgi:hypothetical protein
VLVTQSVMRGYFVYIIAVFCVYAHGNLGVLRQYGICSY